MSKTQFKALGHKIAQPQRELEVFETPKGYSGSITFSTNEFTALCPVTGQPDFCEITIEYSPRKKCIESKSLKLYLWSFRETGSFAEQLAVTIADDIFKVAEPTYVVVTVNQAPRGGIRLVAKHSIWAEL